MVSPESGPSSPIPTPISVSTSQAWENDGAGEWSSFVVSVGTPAQVSRVFVSTAGYETWVVLADGCPARYGNSCAVDRGGIFSVGNSSSWANIELFTLSLETNLGYSGNGQFGQDTVTWGYPNSGGPELTRQIVAGFATPDFWLGQLGLDPKPSNFTTLNDPQSSYLWTLRNRSMIPSTSWGYTAGAAYRYDKVQGSLTLGGYDTSRYSSTNITFPFYNDNSRRFLVSLRSISYIPAGVSTTITSTILLPESMSVYIDSTIPYLFLPLAACAKFESAFGLTWDATNEIYVINDTAHAALITMSPNITFTIANNDGQTLDIILPFGAFVLKASFPVLANGSMSKNYFPLKRAANDTQYTLGRAFLQEAYLIADYDRSEFTIAPCVWPSEFVSKIVAIHPPAANDTIEIGSGPTRSPLVAIIGGVVGGITLLLAMILLYWCVVYRRRRKASASQASHSTAELKNGDGNDISVHAEAHHPKLPEVEGSSVLDQHGEIDGQTENHEVPEIAGRAMLGHELDGQMIRGHELESRQLYELPAKESWGNETCRRAP